MRMKYALKVISVRIRAGNASSAIDLLLFPQIKHLVSLL